MEALRKEVRLGEGVTLDRWFPCYRVEMQKFSQQVPVFCYFPIVIPICNQGLFIFLLRRDLLCLDLRTGVEDESGIDEESSTLFLTSTSGGFK